MSCCSWLRLRLHSALYDLDLDLDLDLEKKLLNRSTGV